MTSTVSTELNIALVRTEHSLIHSSPCIWPDLLVFVDPSHIISCKQRPNNSRHGLRKYSYYFVECCPIKHQHHIIVCDN